MRNIMLMACLGCALFARPSQAEVFQLLGHPSGGNVSAGAISADGSIVAGTYGGDFFRWTAGSGMVSLGRPAVTSGCCDSVKGISADGTTIVGSYVSSAGVQLPFKYRDGSFQLLSGVAPLLNPSFSAEGVSGDGSVVVGRMQGTVPGPGGFISFAALRWTPTGGATLAYPGEAFAVSADGQVTVGAGETGIGRWVNLTFSPFVDSIGHMTFTKALDVSADGSVVVGWGTFPSAAGSEAFRWTASG